MRPIYIFGLAIACVASIQLQVRAADDNGLIPRENLFGNPNRYNSSISPDAKWLAWFGQYNGAMNLWAAPVHDLSKARPLTRDTVHGLNVYTSNYAWAYDNRHIIYLQDRNGDGNSH